MVSPENLKTWGVSFDELFETGLERLRNQLRARNSKNSRAFISVDGTTVYDSSRILIPEVFAPLGLDGDPVVVPC